MAESDNEKAVRLLNVQIKNMEDAGVAKGMNGKEKQKTVLKQLAILKKQRTALQKLLKKGKKDKE